MEKVRLVDLDRDRAERLAAALRGARPDFDVTAVASLEEAATGANGIVNCSPVGMVGHGGTPVPRGFMRGAVWAFDAVYTPVDTRFLADAQATGLDTLCTTRAVHFARFRQAVSGQGNRDLDRVRRRLLRQRDGRRSCEAEASSRRWSAISSSGAHSRPMPKRAWPFSNSSTAGTTPNAVIPGWGTRVPTSSNAAPRRPPDRPKATLAAATEPASSPARSADRRSTTTLWGNPQLRSPRETCFHRLSPTSVPKATALNRPPNRINPRPALTQTSVDPDQPLRLTIPLPRRFAPNGVHFDRNR